MRITASLFKELATPLCRNQNKKPKKYSNSYYEPFIKYINIHNFEKQVNRKSFKKFFLEFCDFYFENENGYRLDFSEKIKLDLLKRSGGCCAICGTLTIFPVKGNEGEALSIGAACHIRPASAYGPRSNVEYRNNNLEKIVSIENGIWACLNCHKEIDQDFITYTIESLIKIKKDHEKNILDIKDEQINLRKLIDNFKFSNNPDYIYINRSIYEKSQLSFISMCEELKNIEKQALNKASFLKLLRQLFKKKEEQMPEVELTLKLSDKINFFNCHYYGDASDAENFKNSFFEDWKKENQESGDFFFEDEPEFKNNELVMVENLSDFSKNVEFFLINEKLEQAIKVEPKERIVFRTYLNNFVFCVDSHCLLINPEGILDFTKTQETLNHFLDMFSFVENISGFNLNKMYIVVRYYGNYFWIISSEIFGEE